MANVSIRMDDSLKKQTETILDQLGITMSTAINMMAKAIVREQGIPFPLTVTPSEPVSYYSAHSASAAVLLTPAEYTRLSEIEEDYQLLLEASERLAHHSAPTASMEEVMKELGIGEEELESLEDVIIE